MRIPRVVILAVVILGILSLQLAFAVNTPARLQKAGTTFVKAPLNPNIIRLVATGVQGTITVNGTLPYQLKSLMCSDMKVYVGKYVTPPPPPGGFAVSTFQEQASAAATGGVPTCSYKVMSVPAGQEFEIVIGANHQKFACNVVELGQQPSPAKLTFTKGKMETKNFQVTPNCVIIK